MEVNGTFEFSGNISVESSEELAVLLNAVKNSAHAALWFYWSKEHSAGPSLCVLKNGVNAWLMYLREEGDVGFHALNAYYDGSAEAMIAFTLENGQVDEKP